MRIYRFMKWAVLRLTAFTGWKRLLIYSLNLCGSSHWFRSLPPGQPWQFYFFLSMTTWNLQSYVPSDFSSAGKHVVPCRTWFPALSPFWLPCSEFPDLLMSFLDRSAKNNMLFQCYLSKAEQIGTISSSALCFVSGLCVNIVQNSISSQPHYNYWLMFNLWSRYFSNILPPSQVLPILYLYPFISLPSFRILQISQLNFVLFVLAHCSSLTKSFFFLF